MKYHHITITQGHIFCSCKYTEFFKTDGPVDLGPSTAARHARENRPAIVFDLRPPVPTYFE